MPKRADPDVFDPVSLLEFLEQKEYCVRQIGKRSSSSTSTKFVRGRGSTGRGANSNLFESER